MRRSPASEIRLTAQVAAAGCAAKLGPGDLRLALGQVRHPKRDPRVLVDASTLDDAGLFAHGRGEVLVQTVDFFTPIVDDPYDYGQPPTRSPTCSPWAGGRSPRSPCCARPRARCPPT
jgi:selenide,water dikinase